MADVGGLIALAAVGDRGEEGSVGFDEQTVEGDGGGGIADAAGGGVGEVPGERDVKAGGDRAEGVAWGAGEAVHDAGEAGGLPMLGDEGEEVFPGVGGAEAGLGGWGGELGGPAVEDDGLSGGGGEFELADEGGFLDGGVRVLDVVIVEADLADGEAEGVGEEAGEFFEGRGGGVGGLVGVNAGGREDPGEAGVAGEGAGVGDLERPVHGVGAVADADGEDGGDAGGVRAAEDGVAFCIVVEVEVGVGIDEHGLSCGVPPSPLLCKVFD